MRNRNLGIDYPEVPVNPTGSKTDSPLVERGVLSLRIYLTERRRGLRFVFSIQVGLAVIALLLAIANLIRDLFN